MATNSDHDELIPGTGVTSRRIEAFSRTVTATASHLISPTADVTSSSYHAAMSELHRELRRPQLQHGVLAMVSRGSAAESLRARLSRREIEHRAVSTIPDALLRDIPDDEHAYSLFDGFRASLPEAPEAGPEGEREHRKRHRRHASRGSVQALEDARAAKESGAPALAKLRRERDRAAQRLEMMGVRKNMCSAEVLELDKKVANLGRMRKIVLDRLADLEEDEVNAESELLELDGRVDEMQELVTEETEVARLDPPTPSSTAADGSTLGGEVEEEEGGMVTPTGSPTFMSQSIYEKLPSPKSAKRRKPTRRRSAAVRHGHFEPGTRLQSIPAHNDMVTALDFDAPFGTMVTAALDDTVRVWDLSRGRCLGLLEGHRASVRCLQVEDNLVATGSIDASVRLWDLSQADYPAPSISDSIHYSTDDDDEDHLNEQSGSATSQPSTSSMANTPVFTLSAHVAEITALHLHKDTLVSGSADKTLRQWDLVKGRCVQTLDVLWAAAQASTSSAAPALKVGASGRGPAGGWSAAALSGSRLPDPEADFVGALQCFDAALACGTADGMVRLWDLRSGQVHRNLVGHTAPVSALQFDDVRLVTASLDRSIRIWDLRTGAIFDAYAYDNPVTSMMFDARRIVAAAGEPVAKVYDKTHGQHWDCGGPGVEETTEDGEVVSPPGSGSTVERVRIKDGFLIEGRRNGEVGVWTC